MSLGEEYEVNTFLGDVRRELGRAKAKFPSSDACVVALGEEFGELCKAMLEESPSRIYAEAVQVASMAARAALEGDASLIPYRARIGVRTYPVGSPDGSAEPGIFDNDGHER